MFYLHPKLSKEASIFVSVFDPTSMYVCLHFGTQMQRSSSISLIREKRKNLVSAAQRHQSFVCRLVHIYRFQLLPRVPIHASHSSAISSCIKLMTVNDDLDRGSFCKPGLSSTDLTRGMLYQMKSHPNCVFEAETSVLGSSVERNAARMRLIGFCILSSSAASK